MKLTIFFGLFLIFVFGCSVVENNNSIMHINEILLNENDIQQLNLVNEDCEVEEYETSEFSPLEQYGFCSFNNLDNSEIIIQYKKFTNLNDLNGAYQYESSHLRSIEGLLSENELGDQSKFYVNNENDYGAEFNEPGVYFYSLWITQDLYLIHVTSKGIEEDKEDIEKIGKKIIEKFG